MCSGRAGTSLGCTSWQTPDADLPPLWRPVTAILRAIAADLDVDARDVALSLLAAPFLLVALWAFCAWLFAIGGPA